MKDFVYITLWINTYIIFYAFCLDYKSKVESDLLKDRIDWKKKQNRNIEKYQEAKNMPIGKRQTQHTLVKRKKVYKQKNHQLLNQLEEI